MKSDIQSPKTDFKVVVYLIAVAVVTAAITLLQIRLRGFEGPLSDYLLIVILTTANLLLLSGVIFMMARSLWKLYIERRQGILGAKFRTKLVAAFVGLSFIPTILVFVIGSGMFTRSIERLFSLKIENALKDSVGFADAYYDHLKKQAMGFGRQISKQMSEERLMERFEPPALKEYFARKASEYDAGSIELFFPTGQPVVVVTKQFPPNTFTSTPHEMRARAFKGEENTAVTDLGKKGEIVRAVAPVYGSISGGEIAAVVAVNYYVPHSLAARADEIRAGYSEYRSSLKGKEPIKRSLRLGFLTVTLTLLLAAIWIALRVASGITGPIKKLAEGTAAVSAGNLDFRVDEEAGDEVGILIESFNRMTADLKDSRQRLEQEIAYKETILSNIDTGVVSLDRHRRIETINPAAERILGVSAADVLGRRYDDAFGFIDLAPVRALFRRLEEGRGRADGIVSVLVRGRTLTLHMRVSALRDSGSVISVITFDDLTDLLRAQKSETWQDVARKLAHELKNPLTPIRLSTERMRKKFSEGAKDFAVVFDEATMTIIQEVDGLKNLLNEFSEFARLPRAAPVLQPLAPVVAEAVSLYSSGHMDIVFDVNVPSSLSMMIDREQMKRVFVNLFQNAVEAMDGQGTISVSARPMNDEIVRIDVTDNGPGVHPEDMARLFEPYFSRKRKGGGLGLAIVERIIADHNGRIYTEPNHPRGAKFVIELPVVNEQRQ